MTDLVAEMDRNRENEVEENAKDDFQEKELYSETVNCPSGVRVNVDLSDYPASTSEVAVTSFSDVIVENLTNEDVEFVFDEEPSVSTNNNKSPKKCKAKTESGYSFFIKHERSELDKIDMKLKLNMEEVNKKWKQLPADTKNVFNDSARKYNAGSKTMADKSFEKKIKKPRKKIKKKKILVENVKVLTNVEFVNKYEAIELKTNKIDEQNRKLSRQISEIKLSILQKSHDLQLRNDSEAQYMIRYQRLSKLHEKCLKL